jgi:hypothetical protein
MKVKEAREAVDSRVLALGTSTRNRLTRIPRGTSAREWQTLCVASAHESTDVGEKPC